MARVLTAATVHVAAAHTAEWLATLEVLAQCLAARGQHLWVFRRDDADEQWLEFTEGKDEMTHRVRGPADDRERALEARLRALATYDAATGDIRWREVPLGNRQEG